MKIGSQKVTNRHISDVARRRLGVAEFPSCSVRRQRHAASASHSSVFGAFTCAADAHESVVGLSCIERTTKLPCLSDCREY